MVKNPGRIKNKAKRSQVYAKYKAEKQKAKKKLKLKKIKEAEELGTEVVKQTPRTIDNSREADSTIVRATDEEVFGDERDDEFAAIFSNEKQPKIMITTRPRPSKHLFDFIADLMALIPNAFFYPRGEFQVKQICQFAANKGFTHLILLGEKEKQCNSMLLCHLPEGPTAYFRVSNFRPSKDIPNHGKPTSHIPELILNNFNTRLGRRVGRFMGSLFPHQPEFEGRQVVTFHNQRDYIFVRHHRYIYEKNKDKTTAKLQELGPRFTLKLRWLQQGTFDTEFGEYEWIHKRGQMDTSRRKFHL